MFLINYENIPLFNITLASPTPDVSSVSSISPGFSLIISSPLVHTWNRVLKGLYYLEGGRTH